MIACYCRVSSSTQQNTSQRAEIALWLALNGFDDAQVTWIEDVDSGAHTRRSGLDRLKEEIFAGRVKMVVVWKLDRLSRNLRDGINLLADWCDKNVRVVSVTQGIDLAGTVGRMIASVLMGVAEIELEHRRDRQAAGIRVARERGVYTGRQPGTTKAKPARAAALRSQGMRVSEIATALGVSRRTAHRYLAG